MPDKHSLSIHEIRAGVAERVRARREEIEETILARIRNVTSDEVETGDVQYEEGQRAAVVAILDYALTGIEQGEATAKPIPAEAAMQAHRAARRGVGLNTILRRYNAAHAVLGDFVMQEADHADLLGHGAELRYLQWTQAWLLDGLIASVIEEYACEVQRITRSPARRRVEEVRHLLAGGFVDAGELGYELDAWHLGLIGTGKKAEQVVRGLSAELGRQVLLISLGEETVWAWFGDQRKPAVADVGRLLLAKSRPHVSLAIGEPRHGLNGLRLTHRQAQAALLVALRKPQWLTRYSDVALLASELRDEELARSLVDIYLPPVDDQRKSSFVLRQTLRAYFAADRNASSAAAALGVARNTLENRLRKVEEQLGRPLSVCLAELEVAVRVAECPNSINMNAPEASCARDYGPPVPL